MFIKILIFGIIFLSTLCVIAMIWGLKKQPQVKVSFKDGLKLAVSGIIAFIADTIGIGSFAVNIALAKLLNTFPDEELPAMNNGAQVIPGTFESFFFMQAVNVDFSTLGILVLGTCIGGLIGGNIVSRLSKQAIRLTMVCCFMLIIGLLVGNELKLLPLGGEALALHSWKLLIGFIGMIFCGALTSVGIGLFAMVQGILFLLNVSPLAAFPIMTTAGAMQQPLTTLVFLRHDKIPLKKTLVLSLGGCVGVLIALPIVTHLSVGCLHVLLGFILLYNTIAIGRAYLRSRPLHNPLMSNAKAI